MKKAIKIFVLLIAICLFSGCNYKEINNYAIISGIAIDVNEKDENKFDVSIQIMNAKKDEESDNSLITFYKATGTSIYEALDRIMLESPKELYLGHNEVLVLSDEILRKKDPINYLDFFMRNSEAEKDSLVMVAKNDKAYDVLKIITPLESIPSKNLKSTISIADTYSDAITVITLDEFISDLTNDGAEAVLPSVEIIGKVTSGEEVDNVSKSDPETKLKIKPLAYFKDNKLKGFLTEDESLGYSYLSNDAKHGYLKAKCNDKNYAVARVNAHSFKEKICFKDDKPVVEINIELTAKLVSYDCSANFVESNKYINELQKKYVKRTKSVMNKTIKKMYKENKIDILKYGSKFDKLKHKEMEKLGYNKKNVINDITFIIKPKVKIISTELEIKSIMEVKNE